MTDHFRLVMCDASGQPVEPMGRLTCTLQEHCKASAELYAQVGYHPPWVSYVAASGSRPVGGGAFIGHPQNGCVEIAYFTLDEFQQQGFATRTARELCAIARRASACPRVFTKTLRESNASTRILEKLASFTSARRPMTRLAACGFGN